MSPKSFLLTLGIFCGGYLSNTLLDEVVDAAEKYFHFQTSTYKTDSNGYIICSPEKPKITNAAKAANAEVIVLPALADQRETPNR
jgi:hypothetical protein